MVAFQGETVRVVVVRVKRVEIGRLKRIGRVRRRVGMDRITPKNGLMRFEGMISPGNAVRLPWASVVNGS